MKVKLTPGGLPEEDIGLALARQAPTRHPTARLAAEAFDSMIKRLIPTWYQSDGQTMMLHTPAGTCEIRRADDLVGEAELGPGEPR